jgi:hypothetical protein
MERHSVPQNIMDIEFKLFGSLTVRQFTTVAATFVIALLIYLLQLPEIVAIPIIFFVVIIGLAISFLTVNGQPFSVWFNNFIASMFSSQRKVYRKTANVTPQARPKQPVQAKVAAPRTRARLQTKAEDPLKNAKFDSEQQFNANVRVDDILEGGAGLDKYFADKAAANLGNYNLKPAPQPAPAANIQVPKAPGNVQARQAEELPSPAPVPAAQPSSKLKIKEVPLQTAAQLAPKTVAAAAPSTAEITAPQPQPATPSPQPAAAQPPSTTESLIAALPTTSNMHLKPNQIAGFIETAAGQPLDNAQVVIKDATGKLVRTGASDVKGRFAIATSLANGDYRVEISKTGFEFPEYKLQLTGGTLPAYKYIAKN